MKEKEFNKWTEVRKKGFSGYVLQNGFIGYGLRMFIVMSFFINKAFADGFTVKNVIFNVSLWAIAGLLFGSLMWYIFEGRYDRELTKRKHSDS